MMAFQLVRHDFTVARLTVPSENDKETRFFGSVMVFKCQSIFDYNFLVSG